MTTYDPTDLQGQERIKSEKDKAQKVSRDTDDSDFKWLMSSRRGRRVVWRLLDRARVFHPSFNTNAMAMAFAEGTKNEGLRTLGQIHALCPELYSVMTKEAINDNRHPDD